MSDHGKITDSDNLKVLPVCAFQQFSDVAPCSIVTVSSRFPMLGHPMDFAESGKRDTATTPCRFLVQFSELDVQSR